MATLLEILGNKATFTDEMEITLGTEKITLGQIRELSTKQQKDLSDKIAAADRKQQEAVETASRAADLLMQLEDAKKKLGEQRTVQPNGSEDDFDTSEWWQPVRKRFADRDTKIDQAIKGIEALTTQVRQAATIWAKDRWKNQFDRVSPRLKKVEAYKDWDFDKVLGYATEKKIMDDDGMPSVERAVLELTKANDLETARKEAYEEGLKKGKTQARLDSMPRPSSATGGTKLPKGKSAVEEYGLEGLGDDVAGDAELMEQISRVADIDLERLQ